MRYIRVVLIASLASWSAGSRAQEAGTRPNVLLIISDDQGYSDFGFMNNEILRTPRLDELASEGAILPNYSTGAACSPGRSMLFTGRNHLLTGVWGVPLRQNLRTDETMMPAFFRAAGYETFYIGKHDCVAQIHTLPWFAGWNDAVVGGGYMHFDPLLSRKPEGEMPLVWKNQQHEGWTSEVWTDEAVRFIKEKKDTSWLLTMAYIIPHTPWEPVDEHHMVSTLDIMPTILDILGIPEPEVQDGHSMLSILEGGKQKGRDFIYTTYNYISPGVQVFPMRAIHTREWSYVYNPWSDGIARRLQENGEPTENQSGMTFAAIQKAAHSDPEIQERLDYILLRRREELFKQVNDPYSFQNLAKIPEHERQLKKMRKLMFGEMKRTGDPLIKSIKEGGSIPETWKSNK